MKLQLIATIALMATFAHAAPGIPVTYTFATLNMDGTPITDLAGAKVYYGTQSSNYTHMIDIPGGVPGATVTFIVPASSNLLPDVTYYLNGTAYNTAGLESDFCTEIAKSYTIKTSPRGIEALTGGVAVWTYVIANDGLKFVRRWAMEKVE